MARLWKHSVCCAGTQQLVIFEVSELWLTPETRGVNVEAVVHKHVIGLMSK